MRRLAYRILFLLFSVVLLAALGIAILGTFTATQHPLGGVFALAVVLGISLSALDPSVDGQFMASKYLWPVLRIRQR